MRSNGSLAQADASATDAITSRTRRIEAPAWLGRLIIPLGDRATRSQPSLRAYGMPYLPGSFVAVVLRVQILYCVIRGRLSKNSTNPRFGHR